MKRSRLEMGTANYPLSLRSLTLKIDSAAARPYAAGAHTLTELVIRATIRNKSQVPEVVEAEAAQTFTLIGLTKPPMGYEESTDAARSDVHSFIAERAKPIPSGRRQSGDIIFTIRPAMLAAVRNGTAGLAFGDFGENYSSSTSDTASAPFGLVLLRDVGLPPG